MSEHTFPAAIDRPKIVCLCGSTRFKEAFEESNKLETLKGNIVLSVGFFMHRELEPISTEAKTQLDCLHLEKIKLADEVLFLNIDGYIGESTYQEFLFAIGLSKRIRFLEPTRIPDRILDVLSP
jgi:hypothetical protein